MTAQPVASAGIDGTGVAATTAAPDSGPGPRPLQIGPVPDRNPPPFFGIVPMPGPGTVLRPRPAAPAAGSRGPTAAGSPERLVPDPSGHPAVTTEPAQPSSAAPPPAARPSPAGPLRPLRPRRSGEFGPRPTPTAELPEPRAWAGRLAICAAQVAAGVRSPAQLARFTAPAVYEALARRRTMSGRRREHPVRPTRVRAVVLSQPADGIVDASVVTDDGVRARAVALRMEGLDGRWIVTELMLG